MSKRTETDESPAIDMSEVVRQCDLAMEPSHEAGEEGVILYIANAAGRAALKDISPEHFADDVWSEPAPLFPEWRCLALRLPNRETPTELVTYFAHNATMRNARVMVRYEPDGDFESFDTSSPVVEMVADETGFYVVRNGVRIAKRGEPGTAHAKTWIPLQPGFEVFDNADLTEIMVKENGVLVH